MELSSAMNFTSCRGQHGKGGEQSDNLEAHGEAARLNSLDPSYLKTTARIPPTLR